MNALLNDGWLSNERVGVLRDKRHLPLLLLDSMHFDSDTGQWRVALREWPADVFVCINALKSEKGRRRGRMWTTPAPLSHTHGTARRRPAPSGPVRIIIVIAVLVDHTTLDPSVRCVYRQTVGTVAMTTASVTAGLNEVSLYLRPFVDVIHWWPSWTLGSHAHSIASAFHCFIVHHSILVRVTRLKIKLIRTFWSRTIRNERRTPQKKKHLQQKQRTKKKVKNEIHCESETASITVRASLAARRKSQMPQQRASKYYLNII